MSDIFNLLATRKYSMFVPGSRDDLLIEYPEFQSIPSFNALRGKAKELLFVWFYCCKASPAMDLPTHSERVEFAVERAWKSRPMDIIERYKARKWSEEVGKAILDMQRFEPSIRIKNKLIAERTQNNLINMLNVDSSKFATLEEQKQFVDMADKGMKVLATIQQLAEGEFGVKEVREEVKAGATREQVAELVREL